MDSNILVFCNPVSIAIILSILSGIFYANKNERMINTAPFVVLGIGLILSVCPLFFGDYILQGFSIVLFIPFSVIISLFYFFYTLKKTAKIIENSTKDNSNVADNIILKDREVKKISSSIFVIYGYFIVNIIIFARILYMLIYGTFGESGGPMVSILTLPWIILAISILLVPVFNLSRKLYNIPIVYFSITFLFVFFQFFAQADKKGLYAYIGSDILYLIISAVLLVKYLKFFKEQQLTQNQNEVQL
ncbi:MAG: hypothetical protein WA064_00555 [Candidatus Moraniibacteriota bacterium]